MVKMKFTIRLMKSKMNDINIYLSLSTSPSLPKVTQYILIDINHHKNKRSTIYY